MHEALHSGRVERRAIEFGRGMLLVPQKATVIAALKGMQWRGSHALSPSQRG